MKQNRRACQKEYLETTGRKKDTAGAAKRKTGEVYHLKGTNYSVTCGACTLQFASLIN